MLSLEDSQTLQVLKRILQQHPNGYSLGLIPKTVGHELSERKSKTKLSTLIKLHGSAFGLFVNASGLVVSKDPNKKTSIKTRGQHQQQQIEGFSQDMKSADQDKSSELDNKALERTRRLLEGLENASKSNAKVFLVDDFASFRKMEVHLKSQRSFDVISVNCKDSFSIPDEEEVTLLQIAFTSSDEIIQGIQVSYLIDIFSLYEIDPLFRFSESYLGMILNDSAFCKIAHDCKRICYAVSKEMGIEISGIFDTQLACEMITSKCFVKMNQMLTHFGLKGPSFDKIVKNMFSISEKMWMARPIKSNLKEIASEEVLLLLQASDTIFSFFTEDRLLEVWENASQLRAEEAIKSGFRSQRVNFDKSSNYIMQSYELFYALQMQKLQNQYGSGSKLIDAQLKNQIRPTSLRVEMKNYLQLIPDRYEIILRNLDNFDAEFFQKKFKELALDLGRRPRYLVEGKWSNLVEDPKEVVTSTDIAEMTLKLSGRFGDDNRAGFDGELHRISCMRNKKGQEYGFTLRVGRCIVGCANSIEDLLLSSTFKDKSILLLGIPGSGKTTIIREICRMLSMSGDNVIIVDTSNEIAGDGNVPHESIGCSRRMMVPNLSRQQAVMIECLQNHTPDVMVIDEIGRKEEALAAKTSKERGIRMFASAHGDFISLMSNPCLNYLVGGIEVVTIGDEAAKRNANKKTKAQRSHSAVFDVVIELSNREFNKWRIIKDVNAAVDKILNREPFTSEIRVFDPDTGRIDISHENEDRKLDLPQFDSELE